MCEDTCHGLFLCLFGQQQWPLGAHLASTCPGSYPGLLDLHAMQCPQNSAAKGMSDVRAALRCRIFLCLGQACQTGGVRPLRCQWLTAHERRSNSTYNQEVSAVRMCSCCDSL